MHRTIPFKVPDPAPGGPGTDRQFGKFFIFFAIYHEGIETDRDGDRQILPVCMSLHEVRQYASTCILHRFGAFCAGVAGVAGVYINLFTFFLKKGKKKSKY